MFVTTTAHGCYLPNVDSFSGGQGRSGVVRGKGILLQSLISNAHTIKVEYDNHYGIRAHA
jgi:hypothetical protein